MNTTDDLDVETVTVAGRVDPGAEEMYWEREYFRQHYYSPGLDYEDYAPAYCVGYIGYAQYGGSFEDAEKSLISNWMRIKGDSRLTPEQAMQAVRAAWTRMEGRNTQFVAVRNETLVGKLLRLRVRLPSLRVQTAALR
ncbi:MAG: hypothetical protein V4684_06800 [Pseudomonadota bacterium]